MTRLDLFLEKKNWAVVGVSPNKFKFGYKIFNILKKNGYNVYPVNPFYDELDGNRIYPSLEDVDGTVDVVSMVVPPEASIDYVRAAGEMGIKNIWFQPDTFNDEIIDLARDLGIEFIDDNCVLKVLMERG